MTEPPDVIAPPVSTPQLLDRAKKALQENDNRAAKRISMELERRSIYQEAWRIRALASCDVWKHECAQQVWNEQSLHGAKLLVQNDTPQMGDQMRMSRFLELAADKAGQVIVLTDSRLVSMLKRSFPRVDVRSTNEGFELPVVDFVASYERLAQYFAPDTQSLKNSFRPLIPDSKKREAYRELALFDKQRIGVLWHSTNTRKDNPDLDDWVEFINNNKNDATFVSVQYHDLKFGYDYIEANTHGKVTRDHQLNHFEDIDSHCAMLASLDLVVATTSTTVHAASCLGVPCIVILDDKQHLRWPYKGQSCPFYPSTIIVRKSGRTWPAVFSEVQKHVETILKCGHA